MEIDTVITAINAVNLGAADIKKISRDQKTMLVIYYFAISDETYWKTYVRLKRFLWWRWITNSICFEITSDEYLDSIVG